MKKSIVVICAFLLIRSISTAELIFESEVISSEPGMWEASLAIDQENNPHVSYRLYHVGGGVQYDKMLYSYKDAQGWASSIFDFNGGAYESLAIDSQGFAHISYYDTPGEDLAYIYWDGTGWQKETVDKYDNHGSVGGFTWLVLDENDNPHISYIDWTGSCRIKYAHDDGTGWEIQEFPGWSARPSMTLDDSGNPHIAAGGQYAYWNGSSWQISTFDGGGVGEVSIELDSAGDPHIAYSDGSIKYAYWNGSGWEVQTISNISNDFSKFSLELDSSDIPHIMYEFCYYATLVNGNWVIESLASGHFEDFTLDSHDLIHFVYTPDFESLVYMHQVPEPTIEVDAEIRPKTINLSSNGKWMVCLVWLPEDYDVADVDTNSILLNWQIQPTRAWINEKDSVVMLKFSRSEVCDILEAGEVELTVSGELVDGTKFEGTDTIRIIDKNRLRRQYPRDRSRYRRNRQVDRSNRQLAR